MTVKDALNGQSLENRQMSGGSSFSEAALEKLKACVDDVAENWNIDPETGDLKVELPMEFYQKEELRNFPKTSKYYVKNNNK